MSEHVGRLLKDRYWSRALDGCGVAVMNSTRSKHSAASNHILSLAPGFSPVTRARTNEKPLKRFSQLGTSHTGLKAGANNIELCLADENS